MLRLMPTVTIPANNWRPRKPQLPLWSYLENGGKRAIEIAHRRWGKDDVALHRAACSAMLRPGGLWHMLPEYSQARKAIWTAVNPHTGKRRIDEAFPHAIRENTNDHEMFIRFKTGATWQVIGSDNYDRLVGASVAGVVFSEWALANPSAWAYLAPIVAENNGWALFITTPRGKNHAHAMYQMAKKDPSWFSEISTIADTHAVSLEVIEQQRREYHALYGVDAGDAMIEQEWYCSFEAAILGSYYGKEMAKVDREGRIRPDIEPWPGVPVHTAWDLGVSRGSDTMTIWFFQVVPSDTGKAAIRVVDYYSGSGYAISHYAQVLADRAKARKYERGIDYVPHDARVPEMTSSGKDGKAKQRIEVMIECGMKPKVVVNHHVADGISAVRQILPRVWFDERCGTGIECLRQYQTEWDDETKRFKDTPKKDWSTHGADAFRYLAMAYREVAVVAPRAPNKALMPVAGGLPPGMVGVTLNDLWDMKRKVGRRI